MRGLRRYGLLKLAGWARVFGARGTARSILETLRAEYPDDRAVLVQVAFYLAEEKRWREALELMSRAAELRPGDVETRFNCAYLKQQLGDHRGAVDAFRQTLELAPDHDRALYGLALSLISLKHLDEAVPVLERNTKLQPMSPYGWYQLGRVQFDRGRRDKAEAIIAHLNTFEPKVAAQLARDTGLPAPPPP
ncbi:MAG: tetratricopeptide repeat protein [Betaproteobacteria bacterium]|jgi:Flp pilus assembly protein TadD|nr:tetratricopeptide repeat protein [Betaproteobacteria bacterium]